jgi:multidrug efflux pump subunit AcrB
MNITQIAIEKRAITTVVLVVILLAGLSAYFNLSRAEDPGFIIRTAVVRTIFPGGSPERVELLVTDKLEEVIQEIPEIDFIESESRTGESVIEVNIVESENEIRPIWDNLRRKVERARPKLPDNVIGPIVNDEFGDVFGTVLTITGEGFTYAELKEIADQVRYRMQPKLKSTAFKTNASLSNIIMPASPNWVAQRHDLSKFLKGATSLFPVAMSIPEMSGLNWNRRVILNR